MSTLLNLKKNTTIKNGVLFSFFSFLNRGISFLLLTIIAHYLSPESYGSINLFNTATSVFAIIICLNTSGLISVNYFKKSEIEFKRTISAVLIIAFSVFIFLSFLVFAIGDKFLNLVGLNSNYLWVSLWICFFTLIGNINLDIWRINEKVLSYGIYSTVCTLLNFILTIYFIVICKFDWQGRVFAQTLSYIVTFLFSIYYMVKHGYLTKLLPNKESFIEAFKFGVPLIPHDSSTWIRQGLDRIYINNFHSTAMVGYYGFSLNFANIIHIVGQAFNNSNSVYIYKNLANNNIRVRDRLKKQTIYITLFYIVLSVLIVVLSAVLIRWAFPAYMDSIKFIPILCLSGFFRCVYFQFVNFLFYYKKTKNLMYISFGFSILHTILSLTLTRYSLFYTALINAGIDLLITCSVIMYSRKVYKLF